jgi:hypothetical protein
MDRRLFIGSGSVSALSFLAGCSIMKMSPKGPMLVDTSEKRAMYLNEMLKKLCTETGPHPIGSPAFLKAAEIYRNEMSRSLPNAKLDKFKFERWVLNGEPELTVGAKKLETYPGHGTLGTPKSGITGKLRKTTGKAQPYELIDTGGVVAAYITVGPQMKPVPLPFYFNGEKVKCLPTFNVGNMDKAIIDQAVENSETVKMNADVSFIPNTDTCNIVGTLPGESTEEILCMAHLDSVYNTEGANDNTATAIMLLMLAHAFSGKKPRKTMTFLATTGEEYDKLGAFNYANGRRSEGTLDNIKYIINWDSSTWGSQHNISTTDEELVNIIRAVIKENNFGATVEWHNSDGFMLDSRAFRETAARAVYANTGDAGKVDSSVISERVWHRPEDKPDSVDFRYFDLTFMIFNETLKRMQKL